MGGLGFGQGTFGQYAVQEFTFTPPTHIASTELAASFILVSDLAASFTPSGELAASYAPVTELAASTEGNN